MSSGLELRERTVSLLEQVARHELVDLQLAREAGELLEDLRAVWVREKRWRNDGPAPIRWVHRAGPVINSREYRRSWSATYIVDCRQACTRCGQELVRGRWAIFFDQGQELAATGTGPHPILTAVTGDSQERTCSQTLL